MQKQPALEIRDLRKTYDNGVEALKGVSMRVEEGDFYALLGPVSWLARWAGQLVGWKPPHHDHDNYGEHL